MRELADVFAKQLAPALAEGGIHIAALGVLGAADRAKLTSEFESRIFPVLTPLAVDPAHPFPYISQPLASTRGDGARPATSATVRFARIKVPSVAARPLPAGRRGQRLRAGRAGDRARTSSGSSRAWRSLVEPVSRHRATPTSTLEEDEAEDLLAAIEECSCRRRRFAPVRLEVDRGCRARARDAAQEELELGRDDVYVNAALLDLAALAALERIQRPDLT